ncbi:MAG: preprotein translocase subunit SecG, partial [Verrucomicrobiota bacterium]
MSFFIGVLTFFLVINCAVLILLVLVQLPKKDAGAGLAFGGGAADALFGAGSGNALTKITKYATIIFFALALSIGIMQDRAHLGNT